MLNQSFTNLIATDTILVIAFNPSVPEFGDFALMLILGLVLGLILGGFVVMRNKR